MKVTDILTKQEINHAKNAARKYKVYLSIEVSGNNLSLRTQKGKSEITMDIEPMGIENGRRNGKGWIKSVIQHLNKLLIIEEMEKAQNNE